MSPDELPLVLDSGYTVGVGRGEGPLLRRRSLRNQGHRDQSPRVLTFGTRGVSARTGNRGQGTGTEERGQGTRDGGQRTETGDTG